MTKEEIGYFVDIVSIGNRFLVRKWNAWVCEHDGLPQDQSRSLMDEMIDPVEPKLLGNTFLFEKTLIFFLANEKIVERQTR